MSLLSSSSTGSAPPDSIPLFDCISVVTNLPCSNHGICLPDTGRCICDPGFTGANDLFDRKDRDCHINTQITQSLAFITIILQFIVFCIAFQLLWSSYRKHRGAATNSKTNNPNGKFFPIFTFNQNNQKVTSTPSAPHNRADVTSFRSKKPLAFEIEEDPRLPLPPPHLTLHHHDRSPTNTAVAVGIPLSSGAVGVDGRSLMNNWMYERERGLDNSQFIDSLDQPNEEAGSVSSSPLKSQPVIAAVDIHTALMSSPSIDPASPVSNPSLHPSFALIPLSSSPPSTRRILSMSPLMKPRQGQPLDPLSSPHPQTDPSTDPHTRPDPQPHPSTDASDQQSQPSSTDGNQRVDSNGSRRNPLPPIPIPIRIDSSPRLPPVSSPTFHASTMRMPSPRDTGAAVGSALPRSTCSKLKYLFSLFPVRYGSRKPTHFILRTDTHKHTHRTHYMRSSRRSRNN